MKKIIVSCFFLLMTSFLFAQNDNQVSLKFNTPYISNNRTVILPADRIPSDFLGCTLGVTSEVDALKNIHKLGIPYSSVTAGVSDILEMRGDIECEGAKFRGVSLWFYNNTFWKIVFWNMETDSKVLTNTIRQKYSKFSRTAPDKYDYIRYIGNSTDLVYNERCLQYTIRGGSTIRWEDKY